MSNSDAEALKTQAKEVLRKVSDDLSEQAYHFRDLASDARYNSEDFIQTNPWLAVGLATGFGVLVGVILARR